MVHILIGIVVVLVAALAVLLIVASMKPNTFRLQRSITIKAPPAKIASMIDDFHAWAAWSPYEKLDPAMTRTFSGATRGKGAIYAWSGAGKAGAGRMEVLDVTSSLVTIKLDFEKPFEGHNVAEFTLVPQDDATEVTWAMHGPNSFVGKIMGTVINMDTMIGKDFEAGLANLKRVTES